MVYIRMLIFTREMTHFGSWIVIPEAHFAPERQQPALWLRH